MKNSLLFAFVMLVCTQLVNSQEKKVLFIGNSYTAYNDLPQMTYDVANSTGDDLIVEKSIVGGSNLEFHATNGFTENRINTNNWDFVSIQGSSVEVALTGPYFDTNVVPYAVQIVNLIKANYSCSQPIFYRTWGHKNGITGTTCTNYPLVCTYENMDDEIANNYQILANTNNALISPVGAVWRYLRSNPNEPDLYNIDESHPSEIGTYVAACTFYTIILRKDPTLITFIAGLDPIVALQIRNAVKLIVYDQLTFWKVGEFDPKANFSYVQNNGEISFTNISDNAESYTWDFGDNNSSTEENPVHNFDQTGNYDVELTVSKCGIEHSFTTSIEVNLLSLNKQEYKRLKLYPNPAQNNINISGIDLQIIKNINLYNLLGKKIDANIDLSNAIFDISNLASGSYFIELITKKGSKEIRRIIKR